MKKPPLPEGATRITPSPPRPARRSHSALTCASVTVNEPSRSGSRTKSFSVPCPLTNGTPPAVMTRSLRAERAVHRCYATERMGHQGVCGVRIVGIQSEHSGVATEPGPLPSDETSGQPNGLPDGSLQVHRSVQHRKHLSVAQRPGRGHTFRKPDGRQTFDLLEEAGGDHPFDALFEPPVQGARVEIQAGQHGVVARTPSS